MARYRFLKVGHFRGKLNDRTSYLHIRKVGEIHDIDEVFAARAQEFGWADPVGDDVEIESERESVDVEIEETSSDGAHEETTSAGAEESTDQKPETARQKRARERQEAKAAKKAKAQSALE